MEIITRPFITEKTLARAAKGYYTFVVFPKSNKAQIADAVSKQYNVKVTNVTTAMIHGKVRRVGRKMLRITKPNWKKAIIHLAPGQKIDAFDVSHEAEKK